MVNIFVNVKSIGKRRPTLAKAPYSLPDSVKTLQGLIEAIVAIEVEKYNARANAEDDKGQLLQFLTQAEIDDKATTGKVGFGAIYSDKKADLAKAVETARQGFEDGLFKVVYGEAELQHLDDPVNLANDDILTFIRLTFLAGRLW
ncbi:MAG: hypothetical protein FWG10_09630 [Eubacteriaceae bacterium]|nr:hypothetical protein [Eubacteriaceae bacterium]